MKKQKKSHCLRLNRRFHGPKTEKIKKRAIALGLIVAFMALKRKKSKKGPLL